MIDIHSHILPAVDDGSKDLAMSLDMARMYVENGFTTVIATPHYIEGSISTKKDKNKKVLDMFKEELKRENIELEILLGNEAYVSMDLIGDLEEGRVASLYDSRYVLLELPMQDMPLYVESLIYELQLKGYTPIIAHPERNSTIVEDPNILYNLIEKGALAQLNLPSLEGRYGEKIKETAEILLSHNMIHFLGTDAHTNRVRSPKVSEGLNILKSLISEEKYEDLTINNPTKLINNQSINIEEPIEYKKRKTKWPVRAWNKISSLLY